MERFDVIVIGQGFAGLTAAKLSVKRGLRTANFEADCMGGLIVNINELEPVPEGAVHSGAELASALALENAKHGVVTRPEAVTAVQSAARNVWQVETESDSYLARHVIVASGAKLRKLGVPGEEQFFGQGVSECADCDGPLFDGRDTVVVGGGDSAFQEALALAQFARKVTVLMRGSGPRARVALRERAAANPKLQRRTHTRVLEILGTPGDGVEAVRIATAQGEQTLACGGVFVFIGLVPNTAFMPASAARDIAGALVTSGQCAMAHPGLWAIGAVRSGYGGSLIDAAVEAQRVIAAL
jgi:thioredoxin reductase (NADPH)